MDRLKLTTNRTMTSAIAVAASTASRAFFVQASMPILC